MRIEDALNLALWTHELALALWAHELAVEENRVRSTIIDVMVQE